MTSARELPKRLAASVNSSIDAAGEMPTFQQKVLEHLGSMDQVMSEHLSAMDGGIASLSELIGPMREDMATLAERATTLEASTLEMARALDRLEKLVAHIDDRIPDPDAAGPIAKAKDALTSGRNYT